MKAGGIIVLVIGKFSLLLGIALWSDPKYSDEFIFMNIGIGFGCLILGDYLLNRAFRIKESENNPENDKKSHKKIIKNT